MKTIFCLTLLFAFASAQAQMITGVWHGKVAGQKAEVKIIKSGDSLAGTSYYYTNTGNFRRYNIKGYFDEKSNQAVWWDDRLIEEALGGLLSAPGKVPLLSRADFNCPGGGTMLLDGSSNEKHEEIKEGSVHLQKTEGSPVFADEWDWVIQNFTVGGNDPYAIDSIGQLAFQPKAETEPAEPVALPRRRGMVSIPPLRKRKEVEPKPATATTPEPVAVTPQKTVEEKFTSRKKKVFTTVPLTGDSVTLSFYDNAIVDGDSISLFLDGRLLFTHVKLSDKPYTVKLAVAGLSDASELTMVAENLGDIQPNTSYMVAMVGEARYTANLASTEESSAVIRLVKPKR